MKYPLSLSVLALALLAAMPAHATTINSYDFDGDLSDSLGRGANLTAFGGSLGGGRYQFELNQGLSLSNALASTSAYTIEIKFQFNTLSTSSWHKLIDFENLSQDLGFYFYSSASTGPFGIQFYPDVLNGSGEMSLHTDAVLRLTRNGVTNEVEGFLNNLSQWKFIDTFHHAVPSGNLLTFFRDDTATSQLEAFGGSVDYIRILDDSVAVPEPSSWMIWSLFGLAIRCGHSRHRNLQGEDRQNLR